jgi:hypothetical protein
VLLFGNTTGNEDPEMADRFMNGVDDGLSAGPDVVNVFIQVENPIECLLRRGDVVAL